MKGNMKSNLLHSMILATLAGGSLALSPDADAQQRGMPAFAPGLGGLDRVVAISEARIEPVYASEEITLISADMRTVANSGLLVQLSAECGLWVEAATAPPGEGDDNDDDDNGDEDNGDDGNGDDNGDATVIDDATGTPLGGRVVVWVEVDGEPVRFGGADDVDGFDDARIAFCGGNAEQIANADAADPLALFEATRSATTFNWVTEALPNGANRVEVKAVFEYWGADGFEAELPLPITAQAAFGNRTLVVQPIRTDG
jgi:hypothetical protein